MVPPGHPPAYLPTSRWRGGDWVKAGAFVVRFCEDLFPELVPVCWQASASVRCGPWHVYRVPGGVWVVGWLEGGGGPGFGVRFLDGVGFRGWGVWWVAVSGWRVLVPGRRGGVMRGRLFPLDPSLTPPPGRLVCCGSRFRPSPRWVGVAVLVGRLVDCSSFLRGWAGLAGALSCWPCSGLVVLNLGSWLPFSLVLEVRPRGCWGCSAVAGSVGRVRVGGLFSCWLCHSRWVGRPGRSGSSSPPSFSPHRTRRGLPHPRIQWANSRVKTLTD